MVSWKQSVVVMSQVFCWRGRTSSVSLQSQHITKIGLNGELETASVVMSKVFCWRGRTSSVSLQSQYIAKIGLNGELENGDFVCRVDDFCAEVWCELCSIPMLISVFHGFLLLF